MIRPLGAVKADLDVCLHGTVSSDPKTQDCNDDEFTYQLTKPGEITLGSYRGYPYKLLPAGLTYPPDRLSTIPGDPVYLMSTVSCDVSNPLGCFLSNALGCFFT